MAAEVFISHSTKDIQIALAVRQYFELNDFSCWMAPDSLPAGKSYAEGIVEGIEEVKLFVLILSSNANESTHVKNEVEQAVSNRLPILILRIEDIQLTKELKYYLQRIHWLNALSEPRDEKIMELVRNAIAILRPQELGETRLMKRCLICTNEEVYPDNIFNCPECGNFLEYVNEIESTSTISSFSRPVNIVSPSISERANEQVASSNLPESSNRKSPARSIKKGFNVFMILLLLAGLIVIGYAIISIDWTGIFHSMIESVSNFILSIVFAILPTVIIIAFCWIMIKRLLRF